jgi:hypothetical protein
MSYAVVFFFMGFSNASLAIFFLHMEFNINITMLDHNSILMRTNKTGGNKMEVFMTRKEAAAKRNICVRQV